MPRLTRRAQTSRPSVWSVGTSPRAIAQRAKPPRCAGARENGAHSQNIRPYGFENAACSSSLSECFFCCFCSLLRSSATRRLQPGARRSSTSMVMVMGSSTRVGGSVFLPPSFSAAPSSSRRVVLFATCVLHFCASRAVATRGLLSMSIFFLHVFAYFPSFPDFFLSLGGNARRPPGTDPERPSSRPSGACRRGARQPRPAAFYSLISQTHPASGCNNPRSRRTIFWTSAPHNSSAHVKHFPRVSPTQTLSEFSENKIYKCNFLLVFEFELWFETT